MSDIDDSDPKDDLDELEWDDALADWEDEIDDSAQAQSGPMPQKPDAPPSRPLYRPPSADEQFARRAPAPRPPLEPTRSVKDSFPSIGDDDEDQEAESTRIAQIPKELIASLVEGERRADPPRPAAAPKPKAGPPSVDLDLDGLLDGMEEETRNYGQPLPAVPPRSATPRVGGAAEAAPDDDVVSSFAPPPRPRAPAASNPFDDDEHEARTRIASVEQRLDSEPPPEPTRIYAPSAAPSSVPPEPTRVATAYPALDSERPAPTRVVTPSPAGAPSPFDEPEEESQTRIAKAPSAPLPGKPEGAASPGAPRLPLPGRPAVPPPGAPRVPPPRPPAPGATGARPPLPAIPRPGAPSVPRPPGAKPAIPRPPPPSIPRPGGAAAKPPVAKAPAPEPAAPAPTPAAADQPTFDAEMPTPVPRAEAKPAKAAPPAARAPALEPPSSDAIQLDEETDSVLLSSVPAAELDRGPAAAPSVPPPLPPRDPRADEVASALGLDAPLASADAELDAMLGFDDEPSAPASGEPFAEPPAEAAKAGAEPRGEEPSPDDAPAAEVEAPSLEEPSTAAGEDELAFETSEPSAEAEAREDDELAFETSEPSVDAEASEDDEVAFETSEPSVEGEASEDEELAFESTETDEGDEDWDDEDWEAIEAAEAAEAAAAQAAQAAQDRGAIAARRSVRSRKPRDETFPMVGDGIEALRLRKRLLTTLAAQKTGAVKARILTSAAELCEQLGDADEARALYRQALNEDRTDVVAIRALRRDAMTRAAWDDLAELFAMEAQLTLSSWERALALTGLAEVHLARRADPAAAEKAAARALELEPRSLSARLLLAEARSAQGRTAQALEALAPAAEGWDDPAAQAAVHVELARHAERAGDLDRARTHYVAAAELDEGALDALIGAARTSSRAGGDPTTAVAALSRLAAQAGGGLRDAILTRASRVATLVGGDPKAGVALLADAGGVLPLQARADAAAATGDRDAELSALAAWASAAGGTDRALALVRMAEALAAGGELDQAEAALRDAALADGSLGTIRLVREIIARRAGDMSRLVEAAAGGALSASARLAAGGAAFEQEREMLESAAAEGHALVAADVLTLDVAAAQGDLDALDAALRRQADRAAPEHRAGSLLALAERAIERGELEAAEALLSEARALSPGDPLLLRPLGRLALQRDATASAALWLEEASAASGARAAFAATEAGRVLARAGEDALGALRRALDAVPGYGPAAWLLKPLATDLGDPLTLGEVHEQLAAAAADPADAAGHRVRGALLRAEADPAGAAALLETARAAVPEDAVLQGLVMRATATAPAARAAMLVESARSAPPVLARVLRLQAAAAYEDAGEHALAAAQYRAVAADNPEDAVVRMGLDRAEITAGEVARVAERRFAAVKDAADEGQRVLALERLADLDQHERKDPASAALSLMSILETSPGHLPSLRALQRYFAEQKRVEDAVPILVRMVEHLEPGPDVTAHARLARRLMLANPEAEGEVADEMLVSAASRADLDLWLAPRVLAAARARGDGAVALVAARKLAELLAGADERASARVRAAELARATDLEGALALLREAVHASPMHPVAAAELARTCESAERWEEAAEAWEAAAKATEVRTRAAALFHRAGRIWLEQLGEKERARGALEQASERDVTHADVFDRLRLLLEAANDRARLAELFGQRLAAGGETAELVELYVKQAKLYTDLRELEHAKAALRAALALMPERIDALRALANLCLEDEDWRGAAEVLIRIARIRKEREELRWVFFTLGDIYDQHMPDPRRAEAAFQRVLKLLPQDVPAMERLAVLYEREGQMQKAAETLAELARLDVDPERNRGHRLKLAETFERLGDARKAEQVLEEARRNAPTDLAVLRAMAELYQRQSAANALGMHLHRAVNDFRHALEADLGDAAAWPGLVEVLGWRGDTDSASVAASAAQALGITDVEMGKLVDARGAAPGLGGAGASEALDDLLAPEDLSAPTRAVFKLAGDALEKSLPFDVNAYRAEKLNPRDTAIRPLALEIGRWFGVPDPQLYVTSAAPRVCVPVYSNPVTLLIGSELLGITDDREKVFVLVRAFKIAHAQLSVVVRAQPQEVVALVGGLVLSYDPHHVAPGADPAHVAEAARRIVKNVQRKAQNELGPLVFEMAGRPGYDPARFAMAASEWGNRVGLLASGSAPAAFSALAKLSGEREVPPDPTARIAMLSRFPEAMSLLSFSISDACFEARRRAGGRR